MDDRRTARSAASPRDGTTVLGTAARFAAQAQRWLGLLNRIEELDITLPAFGGSPEWPHAENFVLLQALEHTNEHRTQIGTVLGALGLQTPEFNPYRYWEIAYLE